MAAYLFQEVINELKDSSIISLGELGVVIRVIVLLLSPALLFPAHYESMCESIMHWYKLSASTMMIGIHKGLEVLDGIHLYIDWDASQLLCLT